MGNIINKLFSIASTKVIFISIFIFAIILLVSNNFVLAFIFLLLIISGYGFFDNWYNNRETVFEKRSQISQEIPILNYNKVTPNTLGSESIEKFEYEGFNFIIIRVEQYQPKAISYPLCPKCDGWLVDSIKKHFPFRISIIFKCNHCNVSYKSKFTKAELMRDVAKNYGFNVK